MTRQTGAFNDFKGLFQGFTLAEVLITLGIIGVVAAMTMPVLIAKHREKVLVTKVKKSYSQLQNALKMYAAQNECSDISCISDTNQTSEQLADKLFSQFQGGHRCTNKSGICKSISIKSNKPYYVDGKTATGDAFTPNFVSSNGTAYKVVQYSTCVRDATSPKRDEDGYIIYDENGNPELSKYKLYYCALFYIDANGVENGPNQFGADIYRFDLNYNGKFVSYTDILPVLTKGKLEYTPYEIGKPKE